MEVYKIMKRLVLILFTIVFSLTFIITMAIASPVLEIVPPAGAPGDEIKINGKGFKPDEEIDVLFVLEDMKIGLGTTKVDVIKADAKGEFSVASGIPMNAKPGSYNIEAIGSMGSNTSIKIEVTPKKK